MNLWQMLMARRGLMDVAEAHERGGAGGGATAGDNEQGNQDPGKQGEQKEQPKGDDDEYAGMTQEELLAELRKSKKAGADLLKENMKRKEKERTLADQLAQYGDIDPARARQLALSTALISKWVKTVVLWALISQPVRKNVQFWLTVKANRYRSNPRLSAFCVQIRKLTHCCAAKPSRVLVPIANRPTK